MTDIVCKCGVSRLEDVQCAECGEHFRAGWIPVSERLPELTEPSCLFRTTGGGVYFGYHLVDRPVWVAPGIRDYYGVLYETVTHWMPLPPPPEDE
jgi:hypothetical protein